MQNIYNQIKEFVEAPCTSRFGRRSHLSDERIALYMRLTSRSVSGEYVETIDIATVDVNLDQQGKGVFSKVLGYIEKLADKHGRTVFVESIVNRDLTRSLQKRGYVLSGDELAPNASRAPQPYLGKESSLECN